MDARELTQENNLFGLLEEALPQKSKRYFTPFYNDYISRKGESKMTKEEALHNWGYISGFGKNGAQKVIETVVAAQNEVAKEAKASGLNENEAANLGKNLFPLEALFKFLPH